MSHAAPLAGQAGNDRWERRFAVLFGGLLGLALLKFGNPAIMERHIGWPQDGYEWLIQPWPAVLGYGLLAGVAAVGLLLLRGQWSRLGALGFVPAAWLLWQVLAAVFTVDAELTAAVLKHFCACVACFYLGAMALGRLRGLGGFWWPVVVGLLLVVANGFDQRLRGLAEMRESFQQHERTGWREFPAEELERLVREGMLRRGPEGYTAHPGLLQRLESSRISSTLFYPNTLAGALLLLLPGSLAAVLGTPHLTRPARGFVAAILGGGAGACLYWSGSKSGWLLALGAAAVAWWRLPLRRALRVGVLCGLVLVGLAGFAWKYAAFFQRGATSVVARFDYWRAALRTAAAHPVWGTGPGTFWRAYERIKSPESEMARLAHNDYLQQASDSGWPGFVLYGLWVGGGLVRTARRAFGGGSWLAFAMWLGVAGWAAHNGMEFGLYIPALAWPAFAMLGWLSAGASVG